MPRGFAQLAQRLDGAESLSTALRAIDRDLLVTAQAVALLGAGATVPAVVALLSAPEPLVRAGVDGLCARGLAWASGGHLGLPPRLMAHFTAEIGDFRPAATIAKQVRVEELRLAVAAHGDAAGLLKPALITRLGALLADTAVVAKALAALPPWARERLDQVRRGYGTYYLGLGSARGGPRDPSRRWSGRACCCASRTGPSCRGRSPSPRG